MIFYRLVRFGVYVLVFFVLERRGLNLRCNRVGNKDRNWINGRFVEFTCTSEIASGVHGG